jgi:hypothetical protein
MLWGRGREGFRVARLQGFEEVNVSGRLEPFAGDECNRDVSTTTDWSG